MSLTIYRSSAGSGKTYTLAREYLSLAVRSPDYYQKILAVTFTNRAAEEMKERVLDFLIAISKGEHELIPAYAAELDKTEEQITVAAREALTHLLHHYRYFNITTIDTFFHRVIRSFSREIGLQGSFGIELDSDKVAEYISTTVYEGAEANPQLKDWLVEFSLSGLLQGKGYDTKFQVMELAQQLFQEDFKKLDQGQFTDSDIKTTIGALKKKLNAQKEEFENRLAILAADFFKALDGASLSVDDLSNKASGPAGFFLKLARKEYNELIGKRVEKAREDPAGWSNKTSPQRDAIIQLAEGTFNPLLEEAIGYYEAHRIEYLTADAVLKHLFTLGLMSDLAQRLQEYKREEDMIMISDLPDFLSQIIDDTGSPFIYDKVGSWYQHFLIDEFQDTSRFQWKNFKPLLEESISTGNKSIIVGDAKQSIYGWRGGDPTLLLETVENELPAYVDPRKNTNYRSARNIVEFNNHLFTKLPKIMTEEMGDLITDRERGLIEKTYDQVAQQVAPGKKDLPGQIQVSFFKAEEGRWKDEAMRKMVDTIEELLRQGHQLSDMAVLVRGNQDAADIVNHVLDYRREYTTKVEVISAEGMLLVNSSIVQLLLKAFLFLIDPKDTRNTADLSFRYLKLVQNKSFSNHEDFSSLGVEVLPEGFVDKRPYLLHLPMLELVEVLIRTFQLSRLKDEYIYLQAFQDAVLEFSKNNRSDLRLFMRWWDDNGAKRSVQMTGALDAIEVITTHKSKGLQYPIVFIPFCNFSLDSSAKPIWLESPYDKGKNLPVDYRQALGDTLFAANYQQEVAKWHLENLNILYVAFTRAENGLFVFCQTPSNQDKPYSNASKLLRTYFDREKPEGWDNETQEFKFGRLPIKAKKPESSFVKLTSYPSSNWSDKLKVRKSGSAYFDDEVEKSRNEGILLHQILSEIIHWQEMNQVLDRYEKSMQITAADKRRYTTLIENLWKDPDIKQWFDGVGEVRTEVVVLPKDGEVKRLDRVVLNGKQATIIDFKSGSPKPQDKSQVKSYIRLLEEMEYETSGYLLYLDSGEVVEVK